LHEIAKDEYFIPGADPVPKRVPTRFTEILAVTACDLKQGPYLIIHQIRRGSDFAKTIFGIRNMWGEKVR
jgi:hypothetical protein